MKLKELCKQLNIVYNEKNPKRSLEEIKKEYLIEQVENKKDYNLIRPLTDEEKRDIKTCVYIKDTLKQVIFATLSMVDGYTLCGSIKDYYELFSIVNSNYGWFRYSDMNKKKIQFISDNNIDINNITIYNNFAKEVDIMFRNIVKDVFSQLEKEMLIYINKKLVFVYRDGKGFKRTKIATNEEIKRLLEVGKTIMTKYNYNNYEDIKYCDKEIIKNEISREFGILYFYNEYELILNKKFLNFDSSNCLELKKQINDLSIKKLSKSKQGKLKEYDVEMINDCIDTLIKIKKPT